MPTNTSIVTKVAYHDNFQPNESHCCLSRRCGKNVSQQLVSDD